MTDTKLNYYVRIDASGRPVAGSVILRQNLPKIGRWKMIPTSECCNGITGTTTTTVAP